MNPAHIQFGKVQLQSPCEVPWETMDPAEGRNKFCLECKKVVHNITGMAPDAIFNLLQSDPGNICVNFVESRLPKDTETKFPKAKPILAYRLHAAAATAAFLLMFQQAQAAPLVKTGIEWTMKANPIPRELGGNTLITGTVVDRNGNLVPEEMEVVISHQDREVLRLHTRGGLFSADLKGLVSPDAHLKIEVLPGPVSSSKFPQKQSQESCDSLNVIASPMNPALVAVVTLDGLNSWSGGKREIVLDEAQNITVEVTYNRFDWIYTGNFGSGGFGHTGGVPWDMNVFPATIMVTRTPELTIRNQDESCTDR